jgi:hypothetical protein
MRPSWKGLSRYRPRLLTLAVLAVVAAVLVLANLSDEVGARRAQTSPAATLAELRAQLNFDAREPPRSKWPYSGMWNVSYGWPLLWHQYVGMQAGNGMAIVGEFHSAGRLAGNVAMWLVMLAAPAAMCEWLLRRYRPRLRWSLRTMLVAIGLVAICCGWFVSAHNQAKIEDPLIKEIDARGGQVWVERWGPDWFDIIGADSLRRRIIGAEIVVDEVDYDEGDAETTERLLKRLASRTSLQRVDLFDVNRWTPGMTAALGEMRQLQVISIGFGGDETPADIGQSLAKILSDKSSLRAVTIDYAWTDDGGEQALRELLAAIGKVPQLESLSLKSTMIASQDLAALAGATNLKSLTLEDVVVDPGDADDDPPLLVGMPPLPGLEALDLHGSDVSDRDLRFLAHLRQLKSLNLAGTRVTGEGLAQLASLKSLEGLAINGEMVSDMGRESLRAVGHLRALHIDETLGMPKRKVARYRKTLADLRKSNPELAIDGKIDALSWPGHGTKPSDRNAANRSPMWSARWALRQWKQEEAKQASGSK